MSNSEHHDVAYDHEWWGGATGSVVKSADIPDSIRARLAETPAAGPLALTVTGLDRRKMSTTEPLYVAVVDDDESFCRSLGRLLRAAGMQLITYSSAEAFLADKKHPQFDCLLLDVQLGGMSGIELGGRLVAEGRYAPFIFITAYDDPGVRVEADAVGCAAFFRKTDSGTDLLNAIRRVAL
jgi:CheY-like chemotaxis protein